ncbi:hypothetical protein [Curtobacterium sp. ZW137]|uniref:hypothetical protein n=1 Tax=Curtobacterium sp. ZW137 TaxID=2485104 RepID=UPI000F4B45F9|nr:hypothetical protein [Curtobacterium sp. ZW137]ROP64694.1 hypothetical protein EDF55_1344 [Curtobacterium sp. ZW137]
MATAREQITEAVAPLLPKTWKLVPYLDSVDQLSQVTVMLHATTIAPHPVTPLGEFELTFEATVLDPQKDPARVWDALDDEVLEAVAALNSVEGLRVQTAEAVAVSGTFGWNVTFTVPYTRTDSEE